MYPFPGTEPVEAAVARIRAEADARTAHPREVREERLRAVRRMLTDHQARFADALARDLGRDGIRVVSIIPGNVQTPRQDRWYTPEGEAEIVKAQCLNGRLVAGDIAAMILFLASDDARLVTGHSFFVDAGWR